MNIFQASANTLSVLLISYFLKPNDLNIWIFFCLLLVLKTECGRLPFLPLDLVVPLYLNEPPDLNDPPDLKTSRESFWFPWNPSDDISEDANPKRQRAKKTKTSFMFLDNGLRSALKKIFSILEIMKVITLLPLVWRL